MMSTTRPHAHVVVETNYAQYGGHSGLFDRRLRSNDCFGIVTEPWRIVHGVQASYGMRPPVVLSNAHT